MDPNDSHYDSDLYDIRMLGYIPDRDKIAEAYAGYYNNSNSPSKPSQARSTPSSGLQTPDPHPSDDEDRAQTGPEDPEKWVKAPSRAEREWNDRISRGLHNKTLSRLMGFTGLESVKSNFLEMQSRVETAKRQKVDMTTQMFGAVITGNPGSGKTMIAKIYAGFLTSLDLCGPEYVTTTGAVLAKGGILECQDVIRQVGPRGGVLFVDDAHRILPNGGDSSLDFIISEMDRLRGSVVFVFAGYPESMEAFLGYSPGVRSRIPFLFKLDDYADTELHRLLVRRLKSMFRGKMRIEEGANGRFMRIVSRRIGRGRGRSSFANAREVHTELERILRRQACRLEECRRSDDEGDDFLLTKADIIGPPPLDTLENSQAWKSLQSMTGLASVKEAVRVLVNRLQVNYDRELAEQSLLECSLNKVFLGNPGTGKTTVAKHYAQILVDIGLLSNGEVVVKNPSDFMGDALGKSESLTKSILDSTRGKVLIIDEAYALASASERTVSTENPYKTAIVDTLVAEVQNAATDDRCVLLLGYEDKMVSMFQNTNPGLGRRFPIASAFHFDDYTDDELRQILEQNLKARCFVASAEAQKVAMDCLQRTRNQKTFSNASEVHILLDKAQESQQKRIPPGELSFHLEPQDFDAEYDRADRAEENTLKLLEGFVGFDGLIDKLQGYQRWARNSRALGQDPRENIPFNFLFRGPPGTGKTTTAQHMGQIFRDMGFLATNEVLSCSAADLVGEFVGHTGPKTREIFQKALGKVLLIDEAYQLGSSLFGNEALIEMVNILTREQYNKKLVTILAGYDEEINQLLATNPGLSSRFEGVIDFPPLSPSDSYILLLQCVHEKGLDTSAIETHDIDVRVIGLLHTLTDLPGWGNARDIKSLSGNIFGRIMMSRSTPVLRVTEDILFGEINAMVMERQKRARDAMKLLERSRDGSQANSLRYPSGRPDPIPAILPPQYSQPPHITLSDAGAERASIKVDESRQDSKSVDETRIDERLEERREQLIKRKLQDMGRCVAGYAWRRESGGYRCEGGSHFMSDVEARKLTRIG